MIQQLLPRICELPLEDQLAIATSLSYLELANTFREAEGMRSLDIVAATNETMQHFGFIENEASWNVVSQLKSFGISDRNEIELSILVLKNVAEQGFVHP